MGDSTVRSGLPGEIATVYEAEAKRLWRAVYAFTRDRDVASDSVAEAFAQCLARGEAVRSAKNWIWKAAFRIAAGELKERGRWAELPPDPGYEMAERDDSVLRAMAMLPARQRAALILRYYADYDARRIGEVLGCSAATARVHASRGKRKLRELLGERDG